MSRKKKKKAPLVAEFNPPKVIRFIGNIESKELHLSPWINGSCQTAEIKQMREFETFEDAVKDGFEGCGICFKNYAQGDAPQANGD